MFPLSTANYLGKTRSRSITVDSGRSQLEMKTMKTILETMGAPKEVGSSKDIILLNVQGNTVGNIPLADYIQGLTVPALGLGDTFDTLEQVLRSLKIYEFGNQIVVSTKKYGIVLVDLNYIVLY